MCLQVDLGLGKTFSMHSLQTIPATMYRNPVQHFINQKPPRPCHADVCELWGQTQPCSMAAMVGAQPPWSMLLWTFSHSFTGCHRYLGGEGGDRSASSRDSLKNGKASSPAIPGSRIEYCPEAPPLPSQRTGHFPPWPSLRLSRHRGKHPEPPRAAPQKAGSEITALHLKEGWKGLWGEKVLDLFWRSLEKRRHGKVTVLPNPTLAPAEIAALCLRCPGAEGTVLRTARPSLQGQGATTTCLCDSGGWPDICTETPAC